MWQVKYVDHMENDQVKECWHQNVTQCHDTYITEFLPSQEQKCEETFWKSCKIDFKEVPFNYSLKQCHTPLVKVLYRVLYCTFPVLYCTVLYCTVIFINLKLTFAAM